MGDQWEEAAKAYKPAGGAQPQQQQAAADNEDWKVWNTEGGAPADKPGFLSSAWGTIKHGPGNLLAAGNAINGFVAHPGTILPAINRMGQQTIDLGKGAVDEVRKGNPIGGLRKGLNAGINAVVPGLGAQSEEAGQEFDKGNTAAGLGKTAGLGVNTVLGLGAPKIAKGTAAAVSNAPRALQAVGSGVKAAAPDLATGGAMIAGGEALAQIPGMAYPARIGVGLSGARAVAAGMRKGAAATRASFSGTEMAPIAGRPAAAGLPAEAVEPAASGQNIKYVQHLGDMRINGRTPAPPQLYDAFGRPLPSSAPPLQR